MQINSIKVEVYAIKVNIYKKVLHIMQKGCMIRAFFYLRSGSENVTAPGRLRGIPLVARFRFRRPEIF